LTHLLCACGVQLLRHTPVEGKGFRKSRV
jgi:hypothetical protein